MKIPLYQIDAFTNKAFGGNPAAVCPLSDWIDEPLMQSIAAENNLAETAFIVPAGDGFQIRWFTPTAEVDLCGHATLAAAYVVFDRVRPTSEKVTFESKSGSLRVSRRNGMLALDFPARPPSACASDPALVAGLGRRPEETLRAQAYLAVYATEADVRSLKPDMETLKSLDAYGIIVTAKGSDVDFVSRFFAPKVGVPEDPVTGSAHCTLVPYWAKRLGKNVLRARQVSQRGGELLCELAGDRVFIAGNAVPYLAGTIDV
jgi:predicted PhzF superfamily epimerase YddE/YHI9